MRIDFDPKKSQKNAESRGLPFERVADFDWGSAIAEEDTRNPYPEQRFVAVGYVGERLHILCFTPIEDGIRVISFRKANTREVRSYEKKVTNE